MSLNDLPKDLVVLIGTKLEDKDLLSLSSTSHRYNKLIRNYFKEFIIVYIIPFEPILFIERTHKYFDQIADIKSLRYKYHRFLTSHYQIWVAHLDYVVRPKSTNLIHFNNTVCVYTNKRTAIEDIIEKLNTKVFNVINIETEINKVITATILKKARCELSIEMKTCLKYDSNSSYSINMLSLDTSKKISHYDVFYWKKSMGTITPKYKL